MLQFKDFKTDFHIDLKKWEIEAYAAIKNNKDSQNERIKDGAFTKTILERFPKNLIKVFWWHREPMGLPLKVEEDSKGLFTVSKISQTNSNEERMVLIKDGVVDRMSIGYETIKSIKAEDDESCKDLLEVKLYEYSPVPIAANEATYILGVKTWQELFESIDSITTRMEIINEQKPFPNEHSCRLKDPENFQDNSFRRTTRNHEGKQYSVIMGKLKGETAMTEQAYRYPKDNWTAAEAGAHCKGHDGNFEAAAKDFLVNLKEGRILSTRIRSRIADAVLVLQELLDLTNPDNNDEEKTLQITKTFTGLLNDMKKFREKISS